MTRYKPIQVVDIFAGPGGLGEGFSSFMDRGARRFEIALSIEKDSFARKTLLLRSFFRKLSPTKKKTIYKYYIDTKPETLTIGRVMTWFVKYLKSSIVKWASWPIYRVRRFGWVSLPMEKSFFKRALASS